jgi:hypothetical protein
MTIKSKRVSEQRYVEMLEVLPPAVFFHDGFLVGEPWDHNAQGFPRYQAFVKHNGRHYEYIEPMTVREFCELLEHPIQHDETYC